MSHSIIIDEGERQKLSNKRKILVEGDLKKKNVNVIGNQVKNMRQYGKKTRKHFTVWISGAKKNSV